MRPVTPAIFIRLPARMKKGTASNGKLSTPAIIRWATMTSGTIPVTRMYRSEATAMAIATGTPINIRTTNDPSRSNMIRLSDGGGVEGLGALQRGIAATPVANRHLQRAQRHQHERQTDRAIDEALRQVDGRHRFTLDQAHEGPDQIGRVGEECRADQVDQGGYHAGRPGREKMEQQIDLDVPPEADAHDRAHEDDDHETIGGDLLGPGEGIVEDVTREELEEDSQRHEPEKRQRQPVLDGVDAQVHTGRLLL